MKIAAGTTDAAALRDLVADVRRLDAKIDRILSVLERTHGARDAHDAALLLQIRESVGAATFTAAHLVRHATIDEALRLALLDADCVDARDVGALFRRLCGTTINGVRLERAAESRDGVLWCVRLS